MKKLILVVAFLTLVAFVSGVMAQEQRHLPLHPLRRKPQELLPCPCPCKGTGC